MADLSKITELIEDEIANAERSAHELGFLAGYNKGLKQGYDNGINEVEAYHVGYDEGYKAGREITKAEREQIYNHGLDASWELAKKIEKIDVDCEYNFAFDGDLALEILQKYSASEAIAKIKEYEEKERCKECKYPLMNPLCGVGNETCNRKQEYEEKQIEKSCDTCEPLKYGCNECGEEKDNWRPKQTEKKCNTCEYMFDNDYCKLRVNNGICNNYSAWTPKQIEKNCNTCEHKDDTDSSECYECVKDIQNHFEEKQIENDCEYREICLTNGTFACRACQNKGNYIPKPYIGYIPYHSKIKTEFDEETRSYVYTVEDNDDEISIDQAIDNLKKGYGIPYKHKTLTLAIKALRMMKEKSPIIQAYADAERNV